MDKDYEKIFALKPIVPDTGQRNTRVFKKATVENYRRPDGVTSFSIK